MRTINMKPLPSIRSVVLSGCFAFVTFALAASAHSATLYVDAAAADGGDGSINNPYNSIQTAVNNIIFGEENTINATGNFSEYVLVDPDHGGVGESTRTIIQGWPGRPRPVNDARGNPNIYGDVVDLTGYYITFRGFEVIGANNAANIWSGIGARYVIVENNISWGAYGPDASKGICFRGSDNGIIRNNEVYQNDEIGIYAPDETDDIEIYNNIVHDNGRYGIRAVGTGDNVYIHDNVVFHNGYRGAQLHPSGISYSSLVPNVAMGLIIEHNTIDDEFTGISIGGINDAVVQGNTITNAKQWAISNLGSERMVIDGNSINIPPEAYGITLKDSNGVIIQNNILYGEGKRGIFLFGGISQVNILNNTIIGQEVGIFMNASPVNAQYKAYNNVFFNNETVIFSRTKRFAGISSDHNAFSQYDIFFARPQRQPRTREHVCSQFGMDCGSIDGVEPHFVDELANDYHLLSISPLIGQGLLEQAPDHDFDRDDRKANGSVDIGADEFIEK